MDTLKKAGLMTQHLDLFHHMQDLRSLLQLAAHMEERGDRAALISEGTLTLIGAQQVSEGTLSTSKGASIAAPVVYRLIAQLKGFEDDEYTVNRKELAALNARAVAELESSDALRAFAETLGRIGAGGTPAAAGTGGSGAGSVGAGTVVAGQAQAEATTSAPSGATSERQPAAQGKGRRTSEEPGQSGQATSAA